MSTQLYLFFNNSAAVALVLLNRGLAAGRRAINNTPTHYILTSYSIVVHSSSFFYLYLNPLVQPRNVMDAVQQQHQYYSSELF